MTDANGTQNDLVSLLRCGTNPLICRLEEDLEQQILAEFHSAGGGDGSELIRFAIGWFNKRLKNIELLHRLAQEFQERFRKALDPRERDERVLRFAEQMGASPTQLSADRKALRLFFDQNAVLERYDRRVGEEERAAVFALDRVGAMQSTLLALTSDKASLWKSFGAERFAAEARRYHGDARVREASFRCLRRSVAGAAAADAMPCVSLSEHTLWELQRAALGQSEPTWVQCEALTTLAYASPVSAKVALEQRFSNPGAGDDLFVRRHAVRLLAAHPLLRKHGALLALAAADPSPAVRQVLAQSLCDFGTESVKRHLENLANDSSAQVRAALLSNWKGLGQALGFAGASGLLARKLRDESGFVIRTALDSASRLAWAAEAEPAADVQRLLSDEVERLRLGHPDLKVRRWAAQHAEQLWCAGCPPARELARNIAAAARKVAEGKVFRVPEIDAILGEEPDLVGRVLSVLAQSDYGFEILPSGKIRRGDLFAFRSWRLIHEWRNPSPDKRQAFPHWIGRVMRGRVAAPSSLMAELAPTKVPGEPLMQADEGGWRNYVPLLDHILSAIDTGESVSVYSPEGVTVVDPPPRFLDRLKARLRLTWRFASYAELRNWGVDSAVQPNAYSAAVGELGVRMRLRPHGDQQKLVESNSARFFTVSLPVVGFALLWEQAKLYFSSLYANSLLHLALFLMAALLWFSANHFRRNHAMRRARKALQVVIGGWGTRGKSGTERLKAAVFSALGHSLVSKTTGNEAMFLYASAFGPVRELFLFRPYDKATIWEQLDLAVLARKLGARVFLWECMGLTPGYVKVLQRHWMCDDIATITNTYPDHEDVQGPAGRNIPEVMTNFIPSRSTLITSEEQMRPMLRSAAAALGTSFNAVGWLEAGLLPEEMLQRFPYEEHPYNVALVLAVAREFGIEPDYALKEMADRVVQDIGALKVYPEAPVRTRRLEFVLGNSANERFGALGNWTRLGFHSQDPLDVPDVWITTVVNNRADRVPRSRVFASILVKDISADRHVLIGSNLKGFLGFIEEAWQEFAPSLTLWPLNQTTEDPAAHLEALARRFRIVHRHEQPLAAVRAMLRPQPDAATLLKQIAEEPNVDAALALVSESEISQREAIVRHAHEVGSQLDEFNLLKAAVAAGGERDRIDQQVREQLWRWFRAKIVIVENYHATGEEIVRQLVELTPPGFRNRIMGMQNIKGTGLDFVYRWHAWETCHTACKDALSKVPARVQRGLRTLAGFQEFGILSEESVRDMLARLRQGADLPGEVQRVQLDLVEAGLEQQLDTLNNEVEASLGAVAKRRATMWVEDVLDAGDAIRRRKRADLIYRELAAERISSERAILELRRLTTRQKGGWLGGDISRLRRRTAKETVGPSS